MTPYRRLRGEAWKPELAEFGEKVLARRPRARDQPDAEPRWDQSIYLGTKWGTTEHFVGDADGAVRKVRSIRRMPLQDRWDRELILKVTGVPGDAGRKFEDREMPPGAAPPAELIVIPHPPEAPLGPQRRGFRIEKADLVKHGYTLLCPKCDAARNGHEAKGTNHSPECRGRFRALFEHANDGRVERAEARRAGDEAAAAAGPHEAGGAADEPMGEALPPGMQVEPPQSPVDDGWGDLARRLRENRQAAAPPGPVAAPGADEEGMSNGTADTEIFEDELEAPSAMLAACKPVQSARWADMSGDEPEDDFETKVTDIETKEDLVTVLTQTRAIPATERARRLCIIGGLSEEATKEVVSELFSPPRVTAALKSKDHGWLRAGSSFDLVVDAVSGQSWDFLQADDRRRCWR
jgi:hypothetical protein